jgi:plastocyanin
MVLDMIPQMIEALDTQPSHNHTGTQPSTTNHYSKQLNPDRYNPFEYNSDSDESIGEGRQPLIRSKSPPSILCRSLDEEVWSKPSSPNHNCKIQSLAITEAICDLSEQLYESNHQAKDDELSSDDGSDSFYESDELVSEDVTVMEDDQYSIDSDIEPVWKSRSNILSSYKSKPNDSASLFRSKMIFSRSHLSIAVGDHSSQDLLQSPSRSQPTVSRPSVHIIRVEDFRFQPSSITIFEHESVTFSLQQGHDKGMKSQSLSCEGWFDSIVLDRRHQPSYTHTFDRSGDYQIVNEVYGFMSCQVKVESKSSAYPMLRASPMAAMALRGSFPLAVPYHHHAMSVNPSPMSVTSAGATTTCSSAFGSALRDDDRLLRSYSSSFDEEDDEEKEAVVADLDLDPMTLPRPVQRLFGSFPLPSHSISTTTTVGSLSSPSSAAATKTLTSSQMKNLKRRQRKLALKTKPAGLQLGVKGEEVMRASDVKAKSSMIVQDVVVTSTVVTSTTMTETSSYFRSSASNPAVSLSTSSASSLSYPIVETNPVVTTTINTSSSTVLVEVNNCQPAKDETKTQMLMSFLKRREVPHEYEPINNATKLVAAPESSLPTSSSSSISHRKDEDRTLFLRQQAIIEEEERFLLQRKLIIFSVALSSSSSIVVVGWTRMQDLLAKDLPDKRVWDKREIPLVYLQLSDLQHQQLEGAGTVEAAEAVEETSWRSSGQRHRRHRKHR